MLFQDHGGLIIMVSLCSLLTCSGSLLFLSIFPPALAYSLDWLHWPFPLWATRETFDLWSPSLVFKKSDSCLRHDVFTQAPRQTLSLNPNTKVLSKNKKINHGRKMKDTCAEAHTADMLNMSLTLQAVSSNVSVDLWRPQRLPITWQR